MTTRAATLQEMDVIGRIAERAVQFYQRNGMLEDHAARFARVGIAEEVLTVHERVITLRLQEMLDGRDGDFMHDIAGIHRHLEKGAQPMLNDGFCPRFALVEIERSKVP